MYTPDPTIVEFISHYMNESHGDALVEIARDAGADAAEAQIVDLTSVGVVFALDGDAEVRFTAPWPGPLRRREDIRSYLQEMQETARFGG